MSQLRYLPEVSLKVPRGDDAVLVEINMGSREHVLFAETWSGKTVKSRGRLFIPIHVASKCVYKLPSGIPIESGTIGAYNITGYPTALVDEKGTTVCEFQMTCNPER